MSRESIAAGRRAVAPDAGAAAFPWDVLRGGGSGVLSGVVEGTLEVVPCLFVADPERRALYLVGVDGAPLPLGFVGGQWVALATFGARGPGASELGTDGPDTGGAGSGQRRSGEGRSFRGPPSSEVARVSWGRGAKIEDRSEAAAARTELMTRYPWLARSAMARHAPLRLELAAVPGGVGGVARPSVVDTPLAGLWETFNRVLAARVAGE